MSLFKHNKTLNDFFHSGWHFDDDDLIQKNRFQILNLTILLSIIALTEGVIRYSLTNNIAMSVIEFLLILINFSFLISLRRTKKYFPAITFFINLEFLLFFFALITIFPPSELKHIWYFAFPVVTFFFEGRKKGARWVILLILSLFISKLQPFIESQYSYAQLFYIAFVLTLVAIMIYFYQYKMDSDNELINKQKELLSEFNEQLELKIKEKTAQLEELNRELERRVEEKVSLLVQKDAMLMNQSRQAAMGEMLSIIAHQWRQPLSTITLQIANLKFNTMLGNSSAKDIDKALDQISNTATYLADTIDDFQNYFKPNKKSETISIKMLINHAVNFIQPRLNMYDVHLKTSFIEDKNITTNINEFTQVLINFINNAIDQLNSKNLAYKEIYILTEYQEPYFKIHIQDNGGGIDEKIIDKIFDAYFSTKRKNGTGIGLYMSKNIVEKQLQGSLSVENNRDGANFTMTLPQSIKK